MTIGQFLGTLAGVNAAVLPHQTNPIREVTVTVPAGKIASALTAFQVKVRLSDMPARWWLGVSSSGGNIRVYDASNNELPVDVPFIDKASKSGWIFFLTNLTTAAQTFTIKTIAGGTAYADTDPYGTFAVWSGYGAVFSGNVLKNRANATYPWSAYVNGATVGAVDLTTRPGWLHCDYNVANRAASWMVAAGLPRTTNWTISCTVHNAAGYTGSYQASPISYCQGGVGWTSENTYYAAVMRQYTMNLQSNSSVGSSNNGSVASSASWENGVDRRVAMTSNSSKLHALYWQGVLKSSATVTTSTFSTSNMTAPALALGAKAGDGYNGYVGDITDAYFYSAVQSAVRLLAETNNWNGTGFYSLSWTA